MFLKSAVFTCQVVLLISSGIHQSAESQTSVPKGWLFKAFVPADYNAGIDRSTLHGGKGNGFVEYAVDPIVIHPQRGPAYLFQAFKAERYKGKRLRITAYAKGERIHGGAFLWLQLEGGGPWVGWALSPTLREGTTDWVKMECVRDVPSATTIIAVGATLAGRGKLWLDDVRIEAVGNEVPIVGEKGKGLPLPLSQIEWGSLADTPQNLDFER